MIFFNFYWRNYIVERDNQGWIKRYNDFKAMPTNQQNNILITTGGKLIQGFEYYQKWSNSLPSDPRP